MILHLFRRELDHSEVERLLPWFANATLNPHERLAVQRHLQRCAQCRDDLADERRLRAEVRQSAADPATEIAYARWEHSLPVPPATAPAVPGWSRASIVGIALVLVAGLVLGVFGWDASRVTTYRTLASPQTASPVTGDGPLLRVVFASDLPLANWQGLLDEIGATVQGPPNSVGAYTVQLKRGMRVQDVLARLRAADGVRFAEPVAMPQPDGESAAVAQ